MAALWMRRPELDTRELTGGAWRRGCGATEPRQAACFFQK
jgi:hypothetical protein